MFYYIKMYSFIKVKILYCSVQYMRPRNLQFQAKFPLLNCTSSKSNEIIELTWFTGKGF